MLRKRVASIYAQYAPEKLPTVEDVVQRHQGEPEALLEALTTKYGPEPGRELPRQGSAGTGDLRSTSSPRRASVADVRSREDHELDNIKRLVGDTGFLCSDHERRWEEAWLGKIPMSTICKSNPDILIEGFGHKHASMKSVFSKWQKRYFVVIAPFVYYFENDKVESAVRGCIYMPRAKVNCVEADGKEGIEVESRVLRKPAGKDGNADYSSFIIAFDNDRQAKVWFEVLTRLSRITAKPVDVKQAVAAERQRTMSMMMVAPTQATLPTTPPAPMRQTPRGSASDVLDEDDRISVSSAKKAQLPISSSELVSRIRRLTDERDATSVNEALIRFIAAKVTDTMELWKLMEEVERIEKIQAPAAQQQSATTPNEWSTRVNAVDVPSNLAAAASQLASMSSVVPSQVEQRTAHDVTEALDQLAPDDASAGSTEAQLREIRRSQQEMQRRFDEQMSALVRVQSSLTAAALQSHMSNAQYTSPHASPNAARRDTSLDITPQQTFEMDAPSPIPLTHERPPALTVGHCSPQGQDPAGAQISARLDRMRSRKKVLDELMRDMPRHQ